MRLRVLKLGNRFRFRLSHPFSFLQPSFFNYFLIENYALSHSNIFFIFLFFLTLRSYNLH